MSDKGKGKEGKEPTTGASDASSSTEGLSKSSPRLSRRKVRKPGKESIAQASTSSIEVDVSANAVRISPGTRIFGTNDIDAIRALMTQVLRASPNPKGDLEPLKSCLAMTEGIAPRNALEGLLAAQMVGVHNLAMDCLRRAALKEQTAEAIDANVHRAVRLLRTFTSQMEALNRNRGKISQQMVVGNVNVNEGGQAIVGTVQHRGPEKASVEDDTRNDQ